MAWWPFLKAERGPIGGDLSHEFLIQAPTGESEVFFDATVTDLDVFNKDLTDDAELEAAFDAVTGVYARTDETARAGLV